jgi:hypothetical protein
MSACLISLLLSTPVLAWGPDGHHAVGAIADKLIAGTHAATEVKAILGDISLKDATVWPDCAKGIDPAKGYTYQSPGRYPECKVYETPEREAEMSDFVRRNDTNCSPKPGEESCHKQYHYADVAIQHNRYDRTYVGTRDDDIVSAVVAALHFLKGEPAPVPFNFMDKREALLVLTHYVGDIHQPLHVGSVYLNAKGKLVNPDSGTFDHKTETRGGNSITVAGTGKNMHSMWDAIPNSLTVNATLLKQVKAVPAATGQIFDWPTAWATDTIMQSHLAFKGLKFSTLQNSHWTTTLPATYNKNMDSIKKKQITNAGAHLAQLLQALWP